MKKTKILFLCVLLTMSTAFATACGNNANNNGTQAPYEDETNTGDGNLKDAGRNLMDSVEDAGGAIMDGVRDMTGTNGNNTTNNNRR